MPDLLTALRQVAEALHREAHGFLPAHGGAVEDLRHPEAEETEERQMTGDEKVYEQVWELGGFQQLYRRVDPLHRCKRHLFRAFVDGSYRSYFLGTVIEHERESPVHFAQIGAAALYRKDDGRITHLALQTRSLLLLARRRLSDQLWHRLESAVGNLLSLADYTEKLSDDPFTDPDAPDLRITAGSKANFEMHRLETEIVKSAYQQLGEGEWLIVDGSLNFPPLRDWLFSMQPNPRVLGVCKSFRRDLIFNLGRGGRWQRFSLAQLLAGLPAGHRTVAFPMRNGKIVFWYVRLRPQGTMDYPLMGVVKVELANPSGEAVEPTLLDELSQALVAERSATPLGRDRRWHALLYPIYLAEQRVKSAFWSPEVVRSAASQMSTALRKSLAEGGEP